MNLRRVPVLGVVDDLPQLMCPKSFCRAASAHHCDDRNSLAPVSNALLDLSEAIGVTGDRVLPPLTDFRGRRCGEIMGQK